MPSAEQQRIVEQIHASGRQLVIALTGGGSGAIAALLQVPGASALMLEAIVPYSATALQQWLGGPVDQYCSERTARAMAMAAFVRARELSPQHPHLLRGVGATASLATNRPKRGEHRIHVAWQSAEVTAVSSCVLAKGARSRAEEEQIATEMVLQSLAQACGIDPRTIVSDLPEVTGDLTIAPVYWSELLLGERDTVFSDEREKVATLEESHRLKDGARRIVLFPGAFNPLHAGHVRMAEIAAERYRVPVTFELSIVNVDKPPLDFIEIYHRLRQLAGRRVLLTRAQTIVEKSALAPGCVFVAGVDTIERIADPRYYQFELAKRDAAISQIAERGCRFLVFGRVTDDSFTTTSTIDIPPALRALCEEVPESEFRADISSTELRADTMGSRGGADDAEEEH